MARVPLTTVLREWTRLGLIGFGGPPAHVALLRELCVERRGWIDAKEFEDANAACGLLPGPASTQLSIYCARRVGGPLAGVIGGIAFIVPGLIAIIALAALTLGSSPPTWAQGIAAGAGAAVLAVILRVGLDLARASLEPHEGFMLWRAVTYLVAGAATVVLFGAFVVLALIVCGLAEIVYRRMDRGDAPPLALGLPGLLAVVTGAAALPALAWTAFKVGALSYGGGFVIIPIMQGDAVDRFGWMTESEFLNAVALGQVTPGPVVQTVAVVGYAAAGVGGALLAAVVAFAPSFFLILFGHSRFLALRTNVTARAFLDGAGPAAVGAIFGAFVPLASGVDLTWQWVLAGAAGVALLALRTPVAWTLVAAALVGALAAVAGAPLPA
ncbi:MAG: chromate efflux transporter [Solirubrobacteraceae bacterium]|nr:chromate efflux transporter [Solirubrobacteraceae bacterium]